MHSISLKFETFFYMKNVNLLPWDVNPYKLVVFTSDFDAHNKAYLKKRKINNETSISSNKATISTQKKYKNF